jgi:hypothetical protein
VLVRSRKEWFDLVSELNGYDRLIRTKSVRAAYFSKGNLAPKDFEAVVHAIKGCSN